MDFTSEIITVRLPETKESETYDIEFKLHKKALCESSLYFKNALDGPWIEAKSRAIDLPEQCQRAFKTYIQYLYGGGHSLREYVSHDDYGLPEHSFPEGSEAQRNLEFAKATNMDDYRLLLKLGTIYECWFLGDYLQAIDFQDTIMDLILTLFTELPTKKPLPLRMSLEIVNGLYLQTSDGSMYRKFVFEMMLWEENWAVWEHTVKHDVTLDKELLRDLACATLDELRDIQKMGSVLVKDPPFALYAGTCRYHSHGAAGICYKKKVGRM